MTREIESEDFLQDFLEEFFLKDRKVFLWGEIDTGLSLRVVQQLKYLYNKDRENPIILYVNSGGGEVEAGLAIIDEITNIVKSGTEIWVVVQGQACSMGAYLLSAGTYSYATQNSTIMLHPIWGESVEENNNKLKRSVDFYTKKEEILFKSIAKKCNKTAPAKFKLLKEEIEKTLWLSADDAKKYGLINDIWQYEWEKQEKNID